MENDWVCDFLCEIALDAKLQRHSEFSQTVTRTLARYLAIKELSEVRSAKTMVPFLHPSIGRPQSSKKSIQF